MTGRSRTRCHRPRCRVPARRRQGGPVSQRRSGVQGTDHGRPRRWPRNAARGGAMDNRDPAGGCGAARCSSTTWADRSVTTTTSRIASSRTSARWVAGPGQPRRTTTSRCCAGHGRGRSPADTGPARAPSPSARPCTAGAVTVRVRLAQRRSGEAISHARSWVQLAGPGPLSSTVSGGGTPGGEDLEPVLVRSVSGSFGAGYRADGAVLLLWGVRVVGKACSPSGVCPLPASSLDRGRPLVRPLGSVRDGAGRCGVRSAVPQQCCDTAVGELGCGAPCGRRQPCRRQRDR